MSIRSEHARRILAVLSHAPKTVTQISHATNLPLSHTSRALSRMRSAGFVMTDGRQGERGAYVHLLPLGKDSLHNDALDRLRTLMHYTPRPVDADFVLIERFGCWLRLAWFAPLGQRLVAFSPSSHSNGNEGVGGEPYWLEDASREEQWWNISSGESASPPDPSLLGRFDQSPVVRFGVARLNPGSIDIEPSSQYFQVEISSNRMIAHGLSHGDWTLATSSELAVICPSRPVTAVGSIRSLRRHSLLTIAGVDAVSLTDSSSEQVQHLPSSLLRHWWTLRYPRSRKLDELSIEEQDAIFSKNLPVGNPSLRRRLRRWLKGIDDAFGEVIWDDGVLLPDNIHVKTDEALLASQRFVDRGGSRCVIDLQHLVPQMEMLVGSSSVRLLVSTKEVNFDHADVLMVKEQDNGDLVIVSNDLLYPIQIELDSSILKQRTTSLDWNPFIIDERLLGNLPYFAMHPPTPLQRLALTEHLMDDGWANMQESIDSLASWIASTPGKRADRWVRIGHSLPACWHNLLDVKAVDATVLAEAAIHSGNDRFGKLLQRRWIRTLSHDVRPLAYIESSLRRNDKKAASHAASLILSNWPSLEQYCGDELWRRALDVWLEEPDVRFVEVIESINKYEFEQEETNLTLQRLNSNSQGPLCRGFLDLLTFVDVSRIPKPEECIEGISLLPPHWWAFEARAWMSEWVEQRFQDMFAVNPVSWPATLLWLKGERCGLPLQTERQHLGVDVKTLESLEAWIHARAEPAADGLLDSLDVVLSPSSSRIGRTHIDVGALLRHDSSTDSLDYLGDEAINQRLLRRWGGANR